ncbi:MAG: YhcB family protein [Halomonas sp.]|uniref:YhcB family protein n=1 Tax=Halomonas sp. TaxID=1486246 RepID=UPI003F932B20
MEASNINLVLIIACLVAGSGIGALGYHLLGSGARQSQLLRQRLAEKERQLNEVRSGLGGHVERLASMAQKLNQDSQALLQEVNDAGTCLGMEPPADLATAAETRSKKAELYRPRDYAEGNSGTLSEDFGLKQQPAENTQQPASH